MVNSTPPSAPSTTAPLSTVDRLLLILPTLAGLGLGLFPLLAAPLFASVTNYPPNDILIYWLAGAGTLGYGVALGLGLLQNNWQALRFPVIATLAFNALAFVGCLIEVIQGRAAGHPAMLLVLALSAIFAASCAWLLTRHRGAPRPEPQAARWLFAFFIFGTIAALGTGLLAYLGPGLFKPLFGMAAVNPFIYRMLGAATIGYGVMGVYEATSRRFAELRLALVMGALFNALAIILGILALISGLPPLLPITLLVAPVILSVGCVVALIRKGQ